MSETVVNEMDNKRSFQVTNPAIAAGFTPFFAMMPIWMIFAFRGVTDGWRIALIILMVLLLCVMVAIMMNVVRKEIFFVIAGNGILIGKKEYVVQDIEQVRYNKKQKYVQLMLKKGINPSVYLKDPQEEAMFLEELELWTNEQGKRLEVIDKQKKS